jgi:hypothetical protein
MDGPDGKTRAVSPNDGFKAGGFPRRLPFPECHGRRRTQEPFGTGQEPVVRRQRLKRLVRQSGPAGSSVAREALGEYRRDPGDALRLHVLRCGCPSATRPESGVTVLGWLATRHRATLQGPARRLSGFDIRPRQLPRGQVDGPTRQSLALSPEHRDRIVLKAIRRTSFVIFFRLRMIERSGGDDAC